MKHGYATGPKLSPLYSAWRGMRQRCLNPNNPGYKYYGGRGIKICKRWDVFQNFAKDMGQPPLGYSLDRKKTDGDYKKSNCQWATKSDQVRNRRKWYLLNNRGANSARAVLTMEQARSIRSLRGPTTHREIAKQFMVSRPTVSRILRNVAYVEVAA